MTIAETSLEIANKPKSVEWRISEGFVGYEEAVVVMEDRVKGIRDGTARELVWLLEHPPLYSAGTSAKADDLRTPDRFPVHKTGRGGQYTYHGPGQRIAYVMLDLNRRGADLRQFVKDLERWIILTLAKFNITGLIRNDRIGVWVTRPDKGPEAEDKIAAIGIRVRRWISYHGISLNVEPELEHFSGIIPCGIDPESYGVTSLADLGQILSLPEVDMALKATFEEVFDVILHN